MEYVTSYPAWRPLTPPEASRACKELEGKATNPVKIYETASATTHVPWVLLRAVAAAFSGDRVVSDHHSQSSEGHRGTWRLEGAADLRACGPDLPDRIRNLLFTDPIPRAGRSNGGGAHNYARAGSRYGTALFAEEVASVAVARAWLRGPGFVPVAWTKTLKWQTLSSGLTGMSASAV